MSRHFPRHSPAISPALSTVSSVGGVYVRRCAMPCELQWLEGEEGESAECESDAVPCELQWLEGEEGESGFAGNELA